MPHSDHHGSSSRLRPSGDPLETMSHSSGHLPARPIASLDRFELGERLGEGGMGIVYRAFDRELRRDVALKTLRRLGADDLLMFKSEFRRVQDIRQKNLVHLGELFEERGQWFFTMELVRGDSFLDYVRPRVGAEEKVDVERLREVLVQLTHGLSALHGASKVHCDVKPSNVMVEPNGRVVILDYGVLRDLSRLGVQAEATTAGTAAYMAPEQAMLDVVGPAADYYGLGAMLFHALVGKPPFDGTVTAILEAKVSNDAPRPSAFADGVPSDLDDLCVALLAPEPARRPTGAEILQMLGAEVDASHHMTSSPPVQAPFVGRQEELAALREAFRDVRRGGPRVVLLTGESGVGKSALVRRFTDSLRGSGSGVVVLHGRCFECESVPYKALDDVLDDASRFIGNLPAKVAAKLVPVHAGLLCEVFPVLQNLAAFASTLERGDPELVPHEKRQRLGVALRDLFTRIAKRWTLVVVIEDLQWADPDGAALLDAIVRPPGAPPALIIGTHRTGDPQSATGLGDPGSLRRIHVPPLPAKDAEELAGVLSAARGGSEACDVVTIAREAHGHPLFIDELVRSGALLGSVPSAAPAGVVLRLDEVLWSRVSELEPVERKTLELVSIAGLPITYDVVAAALGLGFGDVADAVSKLRIARLLRSKGTRKNDVVDTYHDRIRESVVAHLEEESRVRWHEQLAKVFEANGLSDPETLAMHWQACQRPDRAAKYTVRAADDAARSLAFERAARLYRQALTLVEHDAAASASLHECLAEALTNAGRSREAAEVRLTLARTAPEASAIVLRREAAEEMLCSGHFADGSALLRDVVRNAGLRYPESTLEALVRFFLLRLWLLLTGFGMRPAKSGRLDGRQLLRADCAWAASVGLSMTDTIRGTYFQVLAVVEAISLGDPARYCRSLCSQAIAAGAPDRERSVAWIAEARRVAREVGTPYLDGMVALADGGTAYTWGEWRRAAPLLMHAEDAFRERCIGATYELTTTRMMLFRVLLMLGDVPTLRERAPKALAEAKSRNDLYALASIQTLGMVTVHLADDAPDRAEVELEEVGRSLPTGRFLLQHYLTVWAWSQLRLYRGDGLAAAEGIDAVWPALSRSLLLRLAIVRILVHDVRGRARAAAARADRTRAAEFLRGARADAELLARETHPWARPLAAMLSASIAEAEGQRAQAAVHLREAVAAASETHMELHAEAARFALGELEGGDDGAARAEEAASAMRARGITRPDRLAWMLVPRDRRPS